MALQAKSRRRRRTFLIPYIAGIFIAYFLLVIDKAYLTILLSPT
jgi:hypothetical protein